MAKEKEKEGKVLGEIGGSRRQAVPASHAMQLLSPFEEIDRLFDEVLNRGGIVRPFGMQRLMPRGAAPFEGRIPNVDVIDRENEILVRAELPGVKKDDLDLSVTENSLTIKATTSHEERQEEGDYHRCEISRGAFSRTVALPAYVDSEKAKANFNDGVLELNLPKLEQAKRRKISVQ